MQISIQLIEIQSSDSPSAKWDNVFLKKWFQWMSALISSINVKDMKASKEKDLMQADILVQFLKWIIRFGIDHFYWIELSPIKAALT